MRKDRRETVVRQSCALFQKRQNALLHLLLQTIERTFGAHSQHRFAQARITFLQAGKYPASLRNRIRCQCKGCKIAAQRVTGKLIHFGRHDCHITREPDIEIVIERSIRKERNFGRQHQCRFIPQRLTKFLFAQSHALPQSQPVP